jgi:hypothetical protein
VHRGCRQWQHNNVALSGSIPLQPAVARISVGDNRPESLSETFLSALYFEFPVVGRQQKVGQAFVSHPFHFGEGLRLEI